MACSSRRLLEVSCLRSLSLPSGRCIRAGGETDIEASYPHYRRLLSKRAKSPARVALGILARIPLCAFKAVLAERNCSCPAQAPQKSRWEGCASRYPRRVQPARPSLRILATNCCTKKEVLEFSFSLAGVPLHRGFESKEGRLKMIVRRHELLNGTHMECNGYEKMVRDKLMVRHYFHIILPPGRVANIIFSF